MREDLLQNDLLHMLHSDMLENKRTLQMLLTTEVDLLRILLLTLVIALG